MLSIEDLSSQGVPESTQFLDSQMSGGRSGADDDFLEEEMDGMSNDPSAATENFENSQIQGGGSSQLSSSSRGATLSNLIVRGRQAAAAADRRPTEGVMELIPYDPTVINIINNLPELPPHCKKRSMVWPNKLTDAFIILLAEARRYGILNDEMLEHRQGRIPVWAWLRPRLRHCGFFIIEDELSDVAFNNKYDTERRKYKQFDALLDAPATGNEKKFDENTGTFEMTRQWWDRWKRRNSGFGWLKENGLPLWRKYVDCFDSNTASAEACDQGQEDQQDLNLTFRRLPEGTGGGGVGSDNQDDRQGTTGLSENLSARQNTNDRAERSAPSSRVSVLPTSAVASRNLSGTPAEATVAQAVAAPRKRKQLADHWSEMNDVLREGMVNNSAVSRDSREALELVSQLDLETRDKMKLRKRLIHSEPDCIALLGVKENETEFQAYCDLLIEETG
ncbi:hypothetical protein F4804DRAFT_351429 [Jackrogersella minutella]|nr:hypothetical protein F4804DRAFT_351429 [Jackrogersella minutella]